MPDGLALISAAVGFGFVIVICARLGAGSRGVFLEGLFPAQDTRDWPTGVQEADAPRFVFRDAAASVPATPAADDRATRSVPAVRFEELYSGPIRQTR